MTFLILFCQSTLIENCFFGRNIFQVIENSIYIKSRNCILPLHHYILNISIENNVFSNYNDSKEKIIWNNS